MDYKVIYEGKSKLVCEGPDDKSYVMVFKDTATAGNGAKKEELNGKGVLNRRISGLIYDYLMKNGIETHLLETIDDNTVLVKKAEILQVEVIVRNVAAGGFSKKYGVEEGAALHNRVVEFCYKSDELGDPMMNDSQITAVGLATQEELDTLRREALRINDLLIAYFEKLGIRLIDFKLEFGRADGKILLCDEISPDSCRLWDSKTNAKMDKDRFRREMGQVLEGYADVLSRMEAEKN